MNPGCRSRHGGGSAKGILRSVKPLAFLLLTAAPALCGVQFQQHEGRIDVEIDGKPFTSFFYGKDAPKPYLHPLRAPSGKVVTRGFPMENIPGEIRDHPHHRGLWFTHGNVNGYDFWANEFNSRPEKRGSVVLEKIHKVRGGKDQGVIEASFLWQDPKGNTLLREHRTMVFHADPKLRVMDFDLRLEAVSKVTFGDTKEGTFAIRLNQQLDEKNTGTMTSAEGAQKMANIWGKRSPWVDYAGELDGEKLGIAIFDHPANPRHPTYWHARDYGLFATNIFGEHDFYRDKTRNGSMTLEPGKSLRFRYRVVIHPGDTSRSNIGKLYQEYAGKRGSHSGS
ncbi:MAG: PmoA family protein [Acidobacteria bacterium]|nr:PmoA family protein [Acidobacteriota bacterium]MBI3279151.1 PmoA family protein [Acidobacteriota bacterium]